MIYLFGTYGLRNEWPEFFQFSEIDYSIIKNLEVSLNIFSDVVLSYSW